MLFLLIIFVCSCFVGASAHDHYEPFAMDPADLTAVLKQTFAKDVPSLRTVPADITFGCVDIKYNRGSFKIVECGDANYMSFRTGDVLMNGKPYKLVAPYWGIFWHYLRSFGL
ncbi:hypothetical protein EBZ39_18075, partial [bacterium]|nr:hypothetical protein [bacterium]